MLFSDSTIAERKSKTSKVLAPLIKDDEVVVVYAGTPLQKPGGHDQTFSFHPHPDYFWLTGFRRPFGISAFTKADGWVDFVLPVTRDEKIWEGGGENLKGRPIAEFDGWLKGRKTHTLAQGSSSCSNSDIQEAFNDVRRVKDSEEIKLITSIAHMANKGYQKLKKEIRPGITEKEVQIIYESEVLRAGSEKMPYESIVGSGHRAAILHALPTMRKVAESDLILVDAGADVEDYCVDITRVFSVSGKFSTQQKALYDLVLKAQAESIRLCRPGVEWSEVHLASARVIAAGLRDLNILKCSVEESIQTEAVAVFFPHGVGHLVGLKVRDVGGLYNPNPKKFAGARLRVDMKMKAGYLMTVEPGCYFIEALLSDEETRTRYKDVLNWSEIEKWKTMGGVRIEDDIHITDTGPVNLTDMVEK